MVTVQLTGTWLSHAASLDASEEDVTFTFNCLLNEIEDEDLMEVFSEFFVLADVGDDRACAFGGFISLVGD